MACTSPASRLVRGVVLVFIATACATEAERTVVDSAAGTVALRDDMVAGPAGVLHVDDGGSGSGIPVVFVHSFGGSSQHWAAQLAHVRDERRAVAFDLRAHGASAAPTSGDYSVDAFASDISAVVDSLDLQRFVLVGHSLGGAAALAYAGTHPDRVAGLLLVGTPGASIPEQSKPIITSLESDQYQSVMDDYMGRLTTGARPDVARQVDEGVRRLSRDQSISIIKGVFAYDPLTALRRYRGPVLSVSAAAEPEAPTALHNLEPTVKHETMAGTSHWMQLDAPDAFNALLDGFLREIR